MKSLLLHHVDRVFCVPGESYLEVLDALYDESAQIDLIVAKHEGAAANMAEADGKLTGRPGICMVTRGPGATHASIGVHIAQQDSTPMILLVGQVAQAEKGRDVFQEIDYEAMFGSIAKWVVEVRHPSQMPEIVARAFAVAVSGRPGPVVVSLPEDVLTLPCTVEAFRATPAEADVPPPGAMDEVRALLMKAQRPLVVLGGGGWSDAGVTAMAKFATTWGLPVACSFRRQSAFDNRSPQYVGHLSLGMSPALERLVVESDLILAVGSRLTDTATRGYTLIEAPVPRQLLIHFHPGRAEIGRVVKQTLGITCEVDEAAQALADMDPSEKQPWLAWAQGARAAHEAFMRAPTRPAQATGVDLAEAMRHLDGTLPDDAILTNGAGNYAVWVHRFFQYRKALTQLAPVCGAMGYGLPAAIAASLRHPNSKVVCFSGDGCFLMYPQELATAAEFGAKLIVLVINNGMYGTIRMHQEARYPNRVSGTRLEGPDFVALARAFGGHAERVERTEDFADAFGRASQHDGIALLELMTDARQITPAKWIE